MHESTQATTTFHLQHNKENGPVRITRETHVFLARSACPSLSLDPRSFIALTAEGAEVNLSCQSILFTSNGQTASFPFFPFPTFFLFFTSLMERVNVIK